MEKVTIYTRAHNEEAIAQGNTVEVHNTHETYYGVHFLDWLGKELANTNCDLDIVEYDNHQFYARIIIVSPKETK